jgi:hypothetical protein
VRIFTLLDEPILDAICENLRQKLYVRGSNLLYQGGTVEKMVFIVRGKLESIGADGHVASLQEGDVCGEELITWYLEQHSSSHYKGYLSNFYALYDKCIILFPEWEITKIFSSVFRRGRKEQIPGIALIFNKDC